MQNRELRSQLQKLDNLYGKANAAAGQDMEMSSHWAKYLCVLAAGFLENAIVLVYDEFCRRAASPAVAAFANSRLARIQNPKTSMFLEVAGRFKPEWRRELETFVDDNGRRAAVDTIMTNRHLIAHGKNSNITLTAVKSYLEKAVEVVDFIENQTLR